MLSTTKPSNIGEVYLTDDATKEGAPLLVNWTDYTKNLWGSTTVHAADGTPHTQIFTLRGISITLNIAECPAHLYEALETKKTDHKYSWATLFIAEMEGDQYRNACSTLMEWIELSRNDSGNVVIKLVTAQ